jgi:hypothetical protein
MGESMSALPMDDSFWRHINNAEFILSIPVSETRSMDAMQVLYDIYETIDKDTEEAKRLVISMAAILFAAHNGTAEQVWEQLVVDKANKNLDKTLKEILDENS